MSFIKTKEEVRKINNFLFIFLIFLALSVSTIGIANTNHLSEEIVEDGSQFYSKEHNSLLGVPYDITGLFFHRVYNNMRGDTINDSFMRLEARTGFYIQPKEYFADIERDRYTEKNITGFYDIFLFINITGKNWANNPVWNLPSITKSPTTTGFLKGAIGFYIEKSQPFETEINVSFRFTFVEQSLSEENGTNDTGWIEAFTFEYNYRPGAYSTSWFTPIMSLVCILSLNFIKKRKRR